MSFTHGMDVQAVRGVAKALQQIASGDINNLKSRIQQQVRTADQHWNGKDSENFVQEWDREHRPALDKLAERLRDYANKANQNANMQEQGSNQY